MTQLNPDRVAAAAKQRLPDRSWPDTQSIRAYYDQTLGHYRLVWFTREMHAMHFGYWDDNTKSHAQSLANMNLQVAQLLGIRDGHRILDAGCGMGDSALWLASNYDVEVVGITIVPAQVASARSYAKHLGVDKRVTFELQDYTQTTFPDASFNVVWAMESICHAPNKRWFLFEAQRLLRPGGRIGIVEYMRTEKPLERAEESLMRAFCDGWAIPSLASTTEWHRWATEAGFIDTTLTDITEHIRPSFRRLNHAAMLAWPFAGLLRAFRVSTERQHANKRAVLAGYQALASGLWSEQVLIATKPSTEP